MPVNSAQEVCPTAEAIKRVGTEWRLIVIRYLLDGEMGFTELEKAVKIVAPNVIPKTLTRTLSYLEKEGIVKRVIVNTRPFRVKYLLTEKGTRLKPMIDCLQEWGEKWLTKQA